MLVAAAAIAGTTMLAAAPASAMPLQSDTWMGAPSASIEQVGYYGDSDYYRRHHSASYRYDVRHGIHSRQYIYDVTHGYHSPRYERYVRRHHPYSPAYGYYRHHRIYPQPYRY
jgi:hypothetical protein